MKRTPMPARTTPLASSSSLSRAPLRRVSPRRAREQRQRRVAETALGRDGTDGTCARCGRYGYVNGHEKLGRAQGGDPTRPDCLLCPPCNGWCEDFPREAAEQGWKYSRKWSAA